MLFLRMFKSCYKSAQNLTQVCLIYLPHGVSLIYCNGLGDAHSPKLPFPQMDLDTRMVPWPTRVHIPNSILIGSAIIALVTVETNRQPDHATSVRTKSETAPIQMAQCRFPGLAISNAETLK